MPATRREPRRSTSVENVAVHCPGEEGDCARDRVEDVDAKQADVRQKAHGRVARADGHEFAKLEEERAVGNA